MKYTINQIENNYKKHFKKKYLEFDFIPANKIEKVLNENSIILGSIRLKETNKTNCDLVVVESNNREYNFEIINVDENTTDKDKRKSKSKKSFGYLLVGDNTYVEIIKPRTLLIPLLALIGVVGIFFVFFAIIPKEDTPEKPDNPFEVEEGDDWDGNMPQNGETTQTDQESITIPGYANLFVSEDQPNIYLINPDENSVYLKYTIKEGDEVVYETKAIENGKQVAVNMNELLSKGEHNLTFIISSYDIKTKAPCNGATQSVTLTVK